MAEENFSNFITRERERLRDEREQIANQQKELQGQLDRVNNEMRAIDAYEAAKKGKPVATGQTRTRLASRGRKGSKREALLKLITESGGLSRGEIIEKMGFKGDKTGEMSVSNALTALTKGNQVRRNDDRKYVSVAK